MAVDALSNNWFEQFGLQNIGGILGIGFNSTMGGYFWLNNTFTQQSYLVSLTPDLADWAWMDNPPDISSKAPSTIVFGVFNDQSFLNAELPVMLTSEVKDNWQFKTESFRVGQLYQGKDAVTNDLGSQYETQFNLGFNGIGLPETAYVTFKSDL